MTARLGISRDAINNRRVQEKLKARICNDHGQLKLRIGVSFSAASRPPTALIFTRLRKSCGRLFQR